MDAVAPSTHKTSHTETQPAPKLTALERCDQCKAQAWTVWQNADGKDLLFCAHHTNKHEVELRMQGFNMVLDNRDKLNAKPSPSANAD